MHQDISTTVG